MLMEPAVRVHALFQPPVECHDILIPYSVAAENIQRGADGQVNSSLPQTRHGFQISQRACAARVGGRDRGPLPETGDKLLIDATAEPFDIHGVNEELRTPRSELLQAFPAECQVRELLPPVSHHVITPTTPAAAKVQDQPLLRSEERRV